MTQEKGLGTHVRGQHEASPHELVGLSTDEMVGMSPAQAQPRLQGAGG